MPLGHAHVQAAAGGGPRNAVVSMPPEAAMRLRRPCKFAIVWRHLSVHRLTCRHGCPCSAETLADAEQLKINSDLLVPGLSGLLHQ